MQLRASCELEFRADQPVTALLMLRPRSGAAQWIQSEEYSFEPRMPVYEYTDFFGNLCQRVLIPTGTTLVRAHCVAETADQADVDGAAAFITPDLLPEGAYPFLLPSRYCPADQLTDLAGQVTAGCQPGYPQAEAIRSWIHQSVRYEYGTSNTTTTAVDTARWRVGVCRDFSHLGISLCRALNIPARMVVGYALKLDVPDIHAWYEAYVGDRWYVFDATSAQTAGNRIAIAYGRDATDVAFVTQFGHLALENMRVRVEALAPGVDPAPIAG